MGKIRSAQQTISWYDQGKVSLGLFIDLSKAFDTVNHDILLAKLELSRGFAVLHYSGSKGFFLVEINL